MASLLPTKADLRRAVIRTAARAHARHDRTGTRAIAAGLQDNDGWCSEAERWSFLMFARQMASTPSLPGAALRPCAALPATTLPPEGRSAPAGAADTTAARSRPGVTAAPALLIRLFHKGGLSHV
jgi:hypothetical protein